MKKSDKDALVKAFDIPQPQRKSEFIKYYQTKVKKNKTPLFPVIMRYISVPAMAVLIIGVWYNVSKDGDLRNKFGNDNIIMETTSESEKTTVASSEIQTTNSEVRQTTVYTSESKSSDITSAVQTDAAKTDISDYESSPISSAYTVYVNEVKTTSAVQSVVTHALTTETKPVQTTTEQITETVTTTQTVEENINTANDYTFKPEKLFEERDDYVDFDYFLNYYLHSGGSSGGGSEGPKGDGYIEDSIVDGDNPPQSTGSVGEDNVTSGNPNKIPDYMQQFINELKEDSDLIVDAVIDEIMYTAVDGLPLTVENITIKSIISRDSEYAVSDRISVIIAGGFVTSDEYCESVLGYVPDELKGLYLYGNFGNEGEQKVGDNLIFFLKENYYYTDFDGAFVLTTGSDDSVFKKNNEWVIPLGGYCWITEEALLSSLR